MNHDSFRDITSDPAAWRTKASTLRSAAEALWDTSLGLITGGSPLVTPEERDRAVQLFAERLHTSQLLYGLVVETALKARIIELDPANARFVEKRDGHGAVIDVRIQRIGADLGGDGHDLVKLAEIAGVAGAQASSSIFSIESDRVAIHEILAFLSDCVRWSGRYPAPRNANGYYRPDHKIPARILGHYMRDWLDPFLDALLPKE
jgi:hypothetical protein